MTVSLIFSILDSSCSNKMFNVIMYLNSSGLSFTLFPDFVGIHFMLIFQPFLLELESQSYLLNSLAPNFISCEYSHCSAYCVIISFFSKNMKMKLSGV